MIDPGESRLVEMARAGDQDAFGQLYQRSLPQIRAVGCEIFRGPGSDQISKTSARMYGCSG